MGGGATVPVGGLQGHAALPATCHRPKVPCYNHNGAAWVRVVSCHRSTHATHRNVHLRRDVTASGLQPELRRPRGPGALPWRNRVFLLINWSRQRRGDRQAVCGPLAGAEAKTKGWRKRAQGTWAWKRWQGHPLWQLPDRTEPLMCRCAGGQQGKPPRTRLVLRGRACPMRRGRKPTPALGIDTDHDQAEE